MSLPIGLAGCLALLLLAGAASLVSAVNRSEGVFEWLKLSQFASFACGAGLLLRRWPDGRAALCKAVIVAALIHSLIGWWQYWTGALPAGLESPYHVSGLFSHRNQFAIALYLMLPFAVAGVFMFAGTWRTCARAALFLLVLMITLLQTRSVWLGCLAFLASGAVLRLAARSRDAATQAEMKLPQRTHPRLFVLLGSAVALAVVATSTRQRMDISEWSQIRGQTVWQSSSIADRLVSVARLEDNGRLWLWRTTLPMISDHPLTGVGLGNWKLVLPLYLNEQLDLHRRPLRPHNDFLGLAAEAGIASSGIYLTLLILPGFCLWWTRTRRLERASPDRPDRSLGTNCNRFAQRDSSGANDKRTDSFATGALKDMPHFKTLAGAGAAALIGFIVISCFSFPKERISHLIYVGWLLAISAPAGKPQTGESTAGGRRLLAIIPPIAIGLATVSLVVGIQRWKSEAWVVETTRFTANEHSDQAKAALAKALRWSYQFDPLGNSLAFQIGLMAENTGRFDQALAAYAGAIQANPNEPLAYRNRGRLFLQFGKPNNALEDLSRALALKPNYVAALLNRASAHRQLGNHSDALQDLDAALRLRPDHQAALQSRHEVLSELAGE